MKASQRYLSSVNKGNVEVLDLPAGDVDHLLAKFFSTPMLKRIFWGMSDTA